MIGAVLVCAVISQARSQTPNLNSPVYAPKTKDWADLAKLPDWTGVWRPDGKSHTQTGVPWNPTAAAQVAEQKKAEAEGHPKFVLDGCLPPGMPGWMLMSNEAMEILFTPGRVTMLGDGDGNRLRRIYTDGRGHAEDPDLSFHGDSTAHWEGEGPNMTLVIDTVGILPQAQLALSEGIGLANNGDMHVQERIHLVKPTELHDDLVITASKLLTAPYKTTRVWIRQRLPPDITEAVCQQGMMRAAKDELGNDIFVPHKMSAYGQPEADGK
jgi:hypothetical protein